MKPVQPSSQQSKTQEKYLWCWILARSPGKLDNSLDLRWCHSMVSLPCIPYRAIRCPRSNLWIRVDFGTFEHNWVDVIHKYWPRHRDRTITKQRFVTKFAIVWNKCDTGWHQIWVFRNWYLCNPNFLPAETFAASSVTERENTAEPVARNITSRC